MMLVKSVAVRTSSGYRYRQNNMQRFFPSHESKEETIELQSESSIPFYPKLKAYYKKEHPDSGYVKLREFEEDWEKEGKFQGALFFDWDDTLVYYMYNSITQVWDVKFIALDEIQQIIEAAYQKKYFIGIVTSRRLQNPFATWKDPESILFALPKLDPKKRITELYYTNTAPKIVPIQMNKDKYKLPEKNILFVENEIEYIKPVAAAKMNPILAFSSQEECHLHIRSLLHHFDIPVPFSLRRVPRDAIRNYPR